MENVSPLLGFIANTLIGLYFVFFGFWNVYHWRPTLEIMTQKGLPHPYIILAIGIAWQVIAGFMIMLGFFPKIAALTLILFTLIAIGMFHDFWNHSGELKRRLLSLFVTNLTVTLGALLLLLK